MTTREITAEYIDSFNSYRDAQRHLLSIRGRQEFVRDEAADDYVQNALRDIAFKYVLESDVELAEKIALEEVKRVMAILAMRPIMPEPE